MDVLIPEGHKIRLSLTDIGDDYLPPSNAAPVEIGINENYDVDLLTKCQK